jgi:arginine deiminase
MFVDGTVTSEFGRLRQVLIHRPGREQERSVPWEGEHAMLTSNPVSSGELTADHDALSAFLKREIGAENVLTVSQLLAEVFELADGARRREILKDVFGPGIMDGKN